MKPVRKKVNNVNVISLSPSPTALVESLRSIGYTLETALADIIDNSITADSSTISILFMWENSNPWVAIIDNGCGMCPEVLRNAMRFGSTSPLVPRESSDLGRFGLGLKTASISQCRRLTVCSKHNGFISACEWDLDHLATNGSKEWLLKVVEEKDIKCDALLETLKNKHLGNYSTGTIVLWRNMDTMLAGTEGVDSERKFSELMSHARSHLEMVFHRFLSPTIGQKGIKINFNQSELSAFNPFGPNIPARQELTDQEIPLNGEIIKVQPYVLPHQTKVTRTEYEKYAGDGGYLHNQGFYVYRNRRLILKATWFRLIKKEELHKLVRVRIDIPNNLDHIWGINVDKSQVTPPEVVRKQLRIIINRITGAGKQVHQNKATRLINRNVISVWKREIVKGEVLYSVNEEHPLLKDLIQSATDSLKRRIIQSFKLIAHAFPKDAYYNDLANDEHEFAKPPEDVSLELCQNLIISLRICGLNDLEIIDQAKGIEIPGISTEIVQDLIKKQNNEQS